MYHLNRSQTPTPQPLTICSKTEMLHATRGLTYLPMQRSITFDNGLFHKPFRVC